MNTHPAHLRRRPSSRRVSRAFAALAVCLLAPLAVPRARAQTPTFNAVVSSSTNSSYSHPAFAAVGDFNGDGKLDALVTDGSPTLRLMLGNGNGTFTEHDISAPGTNPGPIKAADFNGDGRLDAVTVSNGGNYAATVLLNTGNDASGVPQFSVVNYSSGLTQLRSVTVGDLNGDQRPEFIVGDAWGDLRVFVNHGDGTFGLGQPTGMTYLGGATGRGVIADLNGDGKPDYVVTSNQAHLINIFFGNGDGTLRAPVAISATVLALAVADVNKDGKPDLVAADPGVAQVLVYLNNGDGTFGAPAVYSTGSNLPASLTTADINGDGNLDVVISDTSANRNGVMLGDGTGAFAAPLLFATSGNPQDVAVADFNGDGKPDVGTVSYLGNYGVLLNTTAPAYITPVTTVSAPVLSVPAPISVNATSAAGAVVTFNATATSTISSEIFRRTTASGEAWKAYSVTFAPTISGTYKLRFRTVSDNGADNTFFVDDVHVIANATNTELFHSGFEQPTVSAAYYPAWQGSLSSDVLFGDWTFTNYTGVISGNDPSWGGTGPAEGSQRGFVQSYYGTLGNITSAASFPLVAGETYTVKFYQSTRVNYPDVLTYAVTLESSQSIPVTATPPSGSTFPVGTTTVGLSATSNGGTTTASFPVTVSKAPATVQLTNLNQGYDGTVKSAGAITNPAGLTVDFSYVGARINAGNYAVLAVIDDPLYTGSTTGTLAISPALASFTFGGLTATYDGTPKPVTVTVNPAAAGASVSYNGAATAPTNAGSYAVVATPMNANYSGTGTATLVINPAPVTVTLGNLLVRYDGQPHAMTVTTSPVAVATSVTYNGSTTVPSAAGYYTVVAKVTDPNYIGQATATLYIDATPPTISSVTPSVTTLWSPNKKYVPVTVSVVATDSVGVTAVKILSVATNEPNGDTQWQITGPLSVNLLADRLGTGTGRIYTVTVQVTDTVGNTSTATTTVTVPHDQGK